MKYMILLLALWVPVAAQAKEPVNDQQKEDSTWLAQNYTKKEIYIPMRDGTRLYTAIYAPKSTTTQHPILITRTPYSIAPYGEDKFRQVWRSYHMAYYKKEYIMVYQDVRGRMMSEGEFMDVRPFNADKKGTTIDEASDTYDLIDWLVKNVPNNNGRAGIFGISYPGYYATMGALSGHPALKASSPQAPVTEWFLGDDFHHNGAFMQLDAFGFYSSFGKPRPKPTTSFAGGFQTKVRDNYKFHLEAGTLRNLAKLMGDSITFWKELYDHPNYDEWWQVRNVRNHVQHIPSNTATLVVGGLFDAEDCFGAWELYKAIETKTPNNNKLVMGPWSHGGWSRGTGEFLGNVRFGSKTSNWYQENIEIPYFEHHLRGVGDLSKLPEASIFLTGTNTWRTFDKWPPAQAQNKKIYLQANGGLSTTEPTNITGYTEYTSDPSKPVPYTEDIHAGRTAEYMTDDQRFAWRRPDVLSFTSKTLQNDLTVTGPVIANLFTSISTTDADFVVKLIDVFPDDFSYTDSVDGSGNGKNYPMGGYQMLVRGEIMRGRYRNSFTYPEAFKPGRITEVSYQLPDVAHVFKKGHKLMIQIQSTWFPLADRNPQQFVNIYTCGEEDFVSSLIRIYTNSRHPSNIELPVLAN
jgi:putative CocE/NonD family hydrolase